MKTTKKMSMGGSLKDVPTSKKGLAKLPTEVRNKMGYKKNGGATDPKMKMGGIVKAQYGKEAQEKIAKELGDRRPSDMIEKSKSKNVDGKMGQSTISAPKLKKGGSVPKKGMGGAMKYKMGGSMKGKKC
jgi:hypothetical protein